MSASAARHVYGPVPSRRLGRSLGVDLVPFKVCSYDCVYCQLGRTTRKTTERREWVPLDEVLAELRERLSAGPPCDFDGLAGSGEPTLHSRIGEAIRAIQAMTEVPVAVLTNGSLLFREEVRRDLSCRAEAAGFEVCPASGRELLARSACGVLASGTATLEALLLRRPMVVAYAAHPLSMGLARWLVRVPFCALPNLLAGKALFPEFLQTAVTGPALAEAARGFLEAPEGRRRELDEEMDRLRGRLGERGVYPFWAERVAEAVAA